MVIEKPPKLRTKLESCRTLKAMTGEATEYEAGQMIVVGDTIGIVVEAAGDVDADPAVSEAFVFVYAAEKIIVPKIADTGISFAPGDDVYFDPDGIDTGKGAVTNDDEATKLCGIALEIAGDATTEVLIDLYPRDTPTGT